MFWYTCRYWPYCSFVLKLLSAVIYSSLCKLLNQCKLTLKFECWKVHNMLDPHHQIKPSGFHTIEYVPKSGILFLLKPTTFFFFFFNTHYYIKYTCEMWVTVSGFNTGQWWPGKTTWMHLHFLPRPSLPIVQKLLLLDHTHIFVPKTKISFYLPTLFFFKHVNRNKQFILLGLI